MSNIYMVNSGNNGCCYPRILLPAHSNGFYTDKSSVRAERDSDPKMIEANLKRADIVVLHRPETEEYIDLIKILKADGKKIVIDNDDTFKINDNHPLATWASDASRITLESRNKLFDEAGRLADLVTASTPILAEEYKKINDNVVVLPNCVDPMDWDEPLKNEGEKIRIGLVGSVGYAYDYAHIKDVLKELSDRDDVQLVLFGLGDMKHKKDNPGVTEFFKSEYEYWESLNIETIPWCEVADYPERLNEAKLDIMLIPRRENYFNTCKSNIKFLEASMCEIPVVAQTFKDSPYEEITWDMGLLVEDNDNWMQEINILIDNKELREKMGRNAREYVLKNYNIDDKAHLWADAYNKLIN